MEFRKEELGFRKCAAEVEEVFEGMQHHCWGVGLEGLDLRVTPGDGSEVDPDFARGFEVANLVAHAQGFTCGKASALEDPAELGGFPEERSTAGKSSDERGVFFAEDGADVGLR